MEIVKVNLIKNIGKVYLIKILVHICAGSSNNSHTEVKRFTIVFIHPGRT